MMEVKVDEWNDTTVQRYFLLASLMGLYFLCKPESPAHVFVNNMLRIFPDNMVKAACTYVDNSTGSVSKAIREWYLSGLARKLIDDDMEDSGLYAFCQENLKDKKLPTANQIRKLYIEKLENLIAEDNGE